MCFFDQKIFLCGDFKWGRFRQQCAAEHRTGETCRLKLVMSTTHVNQKCDHCKRLEVKMSRFWKEEQRIMRWKTSLQDTLTPKHDIARSRSASIDVSKRILEDLRRDILKLQDRREYPFASFECESGPNTEDMDNDIGADNAQENTLPSLKFLAKSSSLPKISAEEEPLSSESNMFMLQLLESEIPSQVQGRNEDNKDSEILPLDNQEQDRLAFMLTIRLFYVAFESLISPNGSVRLSSGNILSRDRYHGISPRIFTYIHSLKIDLLHTGLSSQLSEADGEIEGWLPRVMKALRSPDSSVEDAPRQLQRMVATLREIQFRIQNTGFREINLSLTEEQEHLMLSGLRIQQNQAPAEYPQSGDGPFQIRIPSRKHASRSSVSRPAG